LASTEESVYRGWSTLAGYFDGDGTVEFSVKENIVEIRLAFDDNWKPFLEGIRRFLIARGVIPGSVRRKEKSMTWHIVIARITSVQRMAKAMLPYSVKKRRELETALEYLGDKITGDGFVRVMNEKVSSGKRTGKLRISGPPYIRIEGVKQGRKAAYAKGAETRKIELPLEVALRIERDWIEGGLTYLELSKKHGFSKEFLRRTIKKLATRRKKPLAS
jgi:hypothetical protein